MSTFPNQKAMVVISQVKGEWSMNASLLWHSGHPFHLNIHHRIHFVMKYALNSTPENYLKIHENVPQSAASLNLPENNNVAGNFNREKEMKKLILALTVTTFTASAATAQATFETVDANANGTVSMAEANDAGLPWSQDQFTLTDKDGDGELNPEEFAAATQ